MHCVFHGIRFKVDKDWVSVIDTLLFFVQLAYFSFAEFCRDSTLNTSIQVFAAPKFVSVFDLHYLCTNKNLIR